MKTIQSYEKSRGRVVTILGLLLFLVFAAGPVEAQQTPLSSPLNSKEKIQISADRLDADNRSRTFVFKGSVKVVQGTTTITSDQLKVWYQGDANQGADASTGNTRIRDIEASGNVTILFDGRTAKSDKALYSTSQETLTLLGQTASIIDGKNTIKGTKITLYRAKDRITVEGSKKERVEAVFFPSDTDAD